MIRLYPFRPNANRISQSKIYAVPGPFLCVDIFIYYKSMYRLAEAMELHYNKNVFIMKL